MPLAEVQTRIRDAVVAGRAEGAASLIRGGADPLRRLAIHQRHYRASLTRALVARFPACHWLIGSDRLNAAALAFIQACPPVAPCLAEYGDAFPAFLAQHTEGLPYLRDFAELELRLGRVSLAVDLPAVPVTALAAIGEERLHRLVLRVQPGLAYLATEWPVDDLIRVFLSGTPPDRFSLDPQRGRLQVRGARGRFAIERLEPCEWTFRLALQEGLPLAEAAARAEAAHKAAGFDPGRTIGRLFAAGMVSALVPGASE